MGHLHSSGGIEDRRRAQAGVSFTQQITLMGLTFLQTWQWTVLMHLTLAVSVEASGTPLRFASHVGKIRIRRRRVTRRSCARRARLEITHLSLALKPAALATLVITRLSKLLRL